MTYQDYLDGKPVIVTAAVTGGVHGKEANPNLPEQPAEIGRAAAKCEAAGAAIVHLHARQQSGERSFDRDRFQAIADAVRDHTDDIIMQHSTGGTAVPLQARREGLRTDPPPEMASLDMGPLNRYHHLTSENTRATIDTLYAEMAERGIKPELEVFNSGHLNETLSFLDRTSIADPIAISLILGSGTTTPPTPRNLRMLVDGLPAGVEFTTIAFGPHQLPLTTMGLLLGGHVRVGLEDNIMYRQGELASSNAQLVRRSVEIANRLDRPVATPDDARDLLGL